MFTGEEEDEIGAKGQGAINQASIMKSLQSQINNAFAAPAGKAQSSYTEPSTTGAVKEEKTIAELLVEREAQLKEIEQLQEMTQTAFVDALTEDIQSVSQPAVAASASTKQAVSEDAP
jgi:hypothetical protein